MTLRLATASLTALWLGSIGQAQTTAVPLSANRVEIAATSKTYNQACARSSGGSASTMTSGLGSGLGMSTTAMMGSGLNTGSAMASGMFGGANTSMMGMGYAFNPNYAAAYGMNGLASIPPWGNVSGQNGFANGGFDNGYGMGMGMMNGGMFPFDDDPAASFRSRRKSADVSATATTDVGPRVKTKLKRAKARVKRTRRGAR